MALIQCPACGGTCSSQATKCPHCGTVLNSGNQSIQQLPRVNNNKQLKSKTTFSASKSLMLIVATFGAVLAIGSIVEMFFGSYGSESNRAMQFFGLISSFLGMILVVLFCFIQKTKSRIATGVVGVFLVGFCDLVKRMISLIAFISHAIGYYYTPQIISSSISQFLWMLPLTVVSILAVYHVINER